MPPAARVTDLHTCPMAPPPGLPIIPPCAINVLIGFMPAARMTDLCACIGPPPAPVDAIIFGSPTVLIGGLPAARMGDPTAKGGVITTGFPTVLIGLVGIAAPPPPAAPAIVGPLGAVTQVEMPDGSVETHVGANIVIQGDENFRETTLEHLRTLENTPTGASIIESIQSGDHTVTIVETNGGNACGYDNGEARFVTPAGEDGAGTSSTVHFNPERTEIGDGSEDWMTRPPEVGLGHELIHAEQASHGQQHRGETDGVRNRELQAVGLPPYEDNTRTENNLRDDLGEPQRPRY